MTTIWKFPFEINDDIYIEMPKGAEILSVQTQCEAPCLWAKVETEAVKEIRYFTLRGTGMELDMNIGKYIGTFQLVNGAIVFHLFEKKEAIDGQS